MAVTLTPLTTGQLVAVEVLERSGSIAAVPPDAVRASAFLRKARIECADIANIGYPENRFDVGYGACHDVGEALLSAYGYRTRSGAGQQIAIGSFLAAVIDEPPRSAAARRYDRLRRIRNNQDYPAQPVPEVEAERATQSAQQFLTAAVEKGDHPTEAPVMCSTRSRSTQRARSCAVHAQPVDIRWVPVGDRAALDGALGMEANLLRMIGRDPRHSAHFATESLTDTADPAAKLTVQNSRSIRTTSSELKDAWADAQRVLNA